MSNKLTVGHVIGGLAILVVIALIVMFIVARATKQSGSASLQVQVNLEAVQKELKSLAGTDADGHNAIQVPPKCINRYYVPDEDRTPLSGEHSECTLTCNGTNVDRIDYANHHCENELDKALSSNAKKSGIAKYVADTGSYVDYVGCQIAGRVMPSQAPKIIYTKKGFVVDPGTCVLPPKNKLGCPNPPASTMLASTQMPMLGVNLGEAEDIVKGLMKVIGIVGDVIREGEDAAAKFENAAQPIIMQVASIMNSIMNIIGISGNALDCTAGNGVDSGINEDCKNKYKGILDRWKCYYRRFKSEFKTGKKMWNEANCLFNKFKAILAQITKDVQDFEKDAKTPVFRYKMIYRVLSASQNEINDEITKLATILNTKYHMKNKTVASILPIDNNGNGNANMTSHKTVQAAYELIFCHTDGDDGDNFKKRLTALITSIYTNPCKNRQSFDASTNACTADVKSSGKVTENYAPHDMSGHLPTMSAAGVW
jgi:hypothetical protein